METFFTFILDVFTLFDVVFVVILVAVVGFCLVVDIIVVVSGDIFYVFFLRSPHYLTLSLILLVAAAGFCLFVDIIVVAFGFGDIFYVYFSRLHVI